MSTQHAKSTRIEIQDLPQDFDLTESELSRIAGGSQVLGAGGPLQLFPSGPAKGVLAESLSNAPLRLFPSGPAKGIR